MISVRGSRQQQQAHRKGKSRFADDRYMLGQALAVSAVFAVLTAFLLVVKYNMSGGAAPTVGLSSSSSSSSSGGGGFVLVPSALSGGVTRYRTATPLSFRAALVQLKANKESRAAISAVIAASPHVAIYFEMPPVTAHSALETPFEFVLLPSSSLVKGIVDTTSFAEHIGSSSCSIEYFKNLGGDANLIVPCVRGAPKTVYGHLASFVRGAQAEQVDEFWSVAATKALELLSPEPLWVSTNGNGVHFLHLRFDSRPKYYNFDAYKKFPYDSPQVK